MSEIIVGIDLGTTNSEIAVPGPGRMDVVDIDGSPMLPSVVGLDDEGRLIVGAPARNQQALHPERTIRSIKRRMGSDETVTLGEQSYTPQEVSAMILRELKERAEAHLGQAVEKAVITVPAYFSDSQRQATRDAGRIAGLEVLRIINEPTAACLAFEHDQPDARKTVMAFDLGGGTFDVSIVKMDGELVEVEGSHGDSQLGGDDIDQLIHDRLIESLRHPVSGTVPELDPPSAARLLRAAETAKIRLSEDDAVQVLEDNLATTDGETLHLQVELTQSELEEMLGGILSSTLQSVHKALDEAGVNIGQIDEILLVGGSTRTPAIGRMLEREFGITPRIDIHPDLAVVYGAGVMAARTQGCDDHRILVDITPYTFGTSAVGMLKGEYVPHLYCPLIKAGTPLPAHRSQTFYTLQAGQASVNVNVFQGENPDARKNIPLGTFRIEGLDEDAPENSEIVMRMDLDLDGILHVQATEKHTGVSKDIRIDNSLAKLSDEAVREARKRVGELFPESAGPSAPPVEETPEAYQSVHDLIGRAETLLDTMDKVDREDATRIVARLKTGMSEQVPASGLQADIDELEDLLFYLDTSQ